MTLNPGINDKPNFRTETLYYLKFSTCYESCKKRERERESKKKGNKKIWLIHKKVIS